MAGQGAMIFGTAIQGIGSLIGFGQGRKRRQERDLGERPVVDAKDFGQLRPDDPTLNRALEAVNTRYDSAFQGPEEDRNRFQQRRVEKQGRPDSLGQRLFEASAQYRDAQAKGENAGFDPQVYDELVAWARVNDPALWQNLTGGVGQEVLRGYDPETGTARGPNPETTDPEILAEALRTGETPAIPEDPTANDISRLTTKFDYPRAEEAFTNEVEQTAKFGQDVEALLGPEGQLQGQIDEAQARGQEAVSGIQPGVNQAVAESRGRIDQQVAALSATANGGGSVAQAEARRARGLSEFTDDTAQRIEQERTGLKSAFKDDTERMLQEMQAQGMSQREIGAAVRDRSFREREKIADVTQRTNIEVAQTRSQLGLAYDQMTSSIQNLSIQELGATGRAAIQAEAGFAQLKSQAAEANAKYQMALDQSTVNLRAGADSAYLSGEQTYGAMLAHLSETMPQAAQYAAGAYKILEYDDLADYAQVSDNIAFLSNFGQVAFNYGKTRKDQDIAQQQIDAQENAAITSGAFSLAGGVVGSLG